IPCLRHYAITDAQWLDLAALHKKLTDAPDNKRTTAERFIAAVQTLEPHVSQLFRAELIEPKLPTGPQDPLTREPMGLPESHTEKALMKTNFPEWYEFLEKRQKSPVSQLLEIRDAQVRYEMKKSFYSNFNPAENPFTTGDHAAQTNLFK